MCGTSNTIVAKILAECDLVLWTFVNPFQLSTSVKFISSSFLSDFASASLDFQIFEVHEKNYSQFN